MVGVLPIRIVKSNVSSVGTSFSLWRRARNVRLYYPYWQYTDLFTFRFVTHKMVHLIVCVHMVVFIPLIPGVKFHIAWYVFYLKVWKINYVILSTHGHFKMFHRGRRAGQPGFSYEHNEILILDLSVRRAGPLSGTIWTGPNRGYRCD